jgi:HSP20 family protein
MADIIRWDPFAEMASLRQTVDRLFDEARPWRVFGGNGSGSAGYFPVDVYETNDDVVVKASLPGVKPDDIDISVTGQLLTLKAEAREEHEDKGRNWYRRERSTGTYLRQFTLPTEVDAEKAQANFEHGVLELRLPKAESMKPKQIKVQTGQPMIEGKTS